MTPAGVQGLSDAALIAFCDRVIRASDRCLDDTRAPAHRAAWDLLVALRACGRDDVFAACWSRAPVIGGTVIPFPKSPSPEVACST